MSPDLEVLGVRRSLTALLEQNQRSGAASGLSRKQGKQFEVIFVTYRIKLYAKKSKSIYMTVDCIQIALDLGDRA